MAKPSEAQLDTLRELVNIGVGRAAKALNAMLSSHIVLSVPQVSFFHFQEHGTHLAHPLTNKVSAVSLSFSGPFTGTGALVFSQRSARRLVRRLLPMPSDDAEKDEAHSSTMSEVGNIILNSIVGSMSNIMGEPIQFTLPEYTEGPLQELLKTERGGPVVILLVEARFTVESLDIQGNIFLIFLRSSFDQLLETIKTVTPPS